MKKQIKKYLEEIKTKYPEIINDEKINKAVELFSRNLNDFDNLKLIIDILIDKEKELYKSRLKKTQFYYSNKLKNSRESRTFKQIKDAYKKLESLIS